MPSLASLTLDADVEEITTDDDRSIGVRRFRSPQLGEWVAGPCPDCKGAGYTRKDYSRSGYGDIACSACDATGSVTFPCKPNLD